MLQGPSDAQAFTATVSWMLPTSAVQAGAAATEPQHTSFTATGTPQPTKKRAEQAAAAAALSTTATQAALVYLQAPHLQQQQQLLQLEAGAGATAADAAAGAGAGAAAAAAGSAVVFNASTNYKAQLQECVQRVCVAVKELVPLPSYSSFAQVMHSYRSTHSRLVQLTSPKSAATDNESAWLMQYSNNKKSVGLNNKLPSGRALHTETHTAAACVTPARYYTKYSTVHAHHICC
jgi:hypothetical protein